MSRYKVSSVVSNAPEKEKSVSSKITKKVVGNIFFYIIKNVKSFKRLLHAYYCCSVY